MVMVDITKIAEFAPEFIRQKVEGKEKNEFSTNTYHFSRKRRGMYQLEGSNEYYHEKKDKPI